MTDDAQFCTSFGAALHQELVARNNDVPFYDYTTEFEAKDISENKVLAMLCYLIGLPGVIIALLGSNRFPYAEFHVRQALKFSVFNSLH